MPRDSTIILSEWPKTHKSHRANAVRITRWGDTPMLDVTASAKPAAPKTVTTKHLAYALAEQHQLSKKQSLEMIEELVGLITKHLKRASA